MDFYRGRIGGEFAHEAYLGTADSTAQFVRPAGKRSQRIQSVRGSPPLAEELCLEDLGGLAGADEVRMVDMPSNHTNNLVR